MKFSITSSEPDGLEELRTLLIDAAEQLAGPGAGILEARLRQDGNPILLRDADHHPVVVSFDLENGAAALINGLRAVEQLTASRPWLGQIYKELQDDGPTARLVVISQTPLPGAGTLLASSNGLQLYTFRLLEINGETGLWLDSTGTPVEENARQNPQDKPVSVHPASNEDCLPELSKEEIRYFRQL